MTHSWGKYTHPQWIGSVLDRCPSFVDAMLRSTHLAQRYFFWASWRSCAMWQGAHSAILRDITNALVVSAYHGPAVRDLICTVDFAIAICRDIRSDVGEMVAGGKVKYPQRNPSPPLSKIRQSISHLGQFNRIRQEYSVPRIA